MYLEILIFLGVLFLIYQFRCLFQRLYAESILNRILMKVLVLSSLRDTTLYEVWKEAFELDEQAQVYAKDYQNEMSSLLKMYGQDPKQFVTRNGEMTAEGKDILFKGFFMSDFNGRLFSRHLEDQEKEDNG